MSRKRVEADISAKNWAPFTRNLRFYMIDRGLMQEDLARLLGTTQTTVSTWVTGRRAPSMEFVYRLRKVFKVSFDDLMSDHNVPEISNLQLYENYVRLYRTIFPDDTDIVIPDDYIDVCNKVMSYVLSDRDREMVIQRFGLNGESPKTFAEVAAVMSVSRQRIEQITHRSVEKLRDYKQYLTAPYGPVHKDRETAEGDFTKARESCYSAVKELLETASKQLDDIFGYSEEQTDALEKINNIPIEAADFDIRTYNCLKRDNINTIGDMLNVSDSELMNIHAFGSTCLNHVHAKQNAIHSNPSGWLKTLQKQSENRKKGA